MGFKGLEHKLKRLGFRGIARFAPGPDSRPTEADLRAVRKVLIVRLDDRIGNAVLLSPLLIAAEAAFARATISCLLSRRFYDLAEYLSAVDTFIPYDKRAYAHNPLKLWGLVRSLKKEHFDLVIDASDELELSFNHAVVTAFSGGKYRIGYDRRGSSRWLELAVKPGDPRRHATQMYLDLLRALGATPQSPLPALNINRVNSFGAEFRQKQHIPANIPLVVMHPGGRGPKRWPLTRFLRLAERVSDELSAHPVLIWGPAEDSLIEAARPSLPAGVTLAGRLPFADLISLFRSAAAYLSNDNGIMHLAAACGVPTVGIFVVSNIEKYRPLGPLDRAIDETTNPVQTTEIIETLGGILEDTLADGTITDPEIEDRLPAEKGRRE